MERERYNPSEKYPFTFKNISENLKLLKGGLVSFDIDAVTQQTSDLSLKKASHILKKYITISDIVKYWGLKDIAAKNGMNEKEALEFSLYCWNDHSVYSGSPVLPGTLTLLRLFEEARIPYMFISSRPTEFKLTTKRWFEKNLPWVDPKNIIVERVGAAFGGSYKSDMINKYGVVLHIEDAVEEARAIAQETSAKVIIVPQPWNQSGRFFHPNIKYLGEFRYSGTFPLIKFLASDNAKDFLDHVAHY